MRIVFAGTPEPALPALEAVAASRHELVGVVTRPDAQSGRGRRLVASPVAERASGRPSEPGAEAPGAVKGRRFLGKRYGGVKHSP